ncbi:MAG: o-succinylbenzoate synthase [Sulfuricellaceae bacterium]|nr:o-succinylbenzoate synthase [Sulfuricellaceae bacterium]
MRLSLSRVIPYRLALRRQWKTAAGRMEARSGALLRLESENGQVGWGDCAPLVGDVSEQLSAWQKKLPGMALTQARESLKHADLPPAAACAVETALLDLEARSRSLSLARLLNPDAADEVSCNAALGELGGEALDDAQMALEQGFRILKLKTGLLDFRRELAMLDKLAAALPPGAQLRLDANRAWDDRQARYVVDGLAGLPVEMLEEPLSAPSVEKIQALQASTKIPLALDESLPELGVERILASRAVLRLVLKPMVWGGLRGLLDIDQAARAAGLSCVVTTTVDSAVGVRAALHAAAALNNGLSHGLATSSWLAEDVGLSPEIRAGRMRLEEDVGLGFELFRENTA